MEELQAQHRKQQRDLQSQITQKKKSATKKTRKSVNDECTKLEQDIKSRQEHELAQLEHGDAPEPARDASAKADIADQDSSDLLASIASASIGDTASKKPEKAGVSIEEDGAPEATTETKKPNRQKARLARRAAEHEAASVQAAEEAAKLPDKKTQERTKMLEEIKKRGLYENEVAANGHCLYLAVADQMNQFRSKSGEGSETVDYKQTRSAAADYMSHHPDDFIPFLEEPLDQYLGKIRNTGEWGSQLELLALAKTYAININVLQGDGRVEKIDSESATSSPEAWLAYYRHGFGLGEHYNSLRLGDITAPKG